MNHQGTGAICMLSLKVIRGAVHLSLRNASLNSGATMAAPMMMHHSFCKQYCWQWSQSRIHQVHPMAQRLGDMCPKFTPRNASDNKKRTASSMPGAIIWSLNWLRWMPKTLPSPFMKKKTKEQNSNKSKPLTKVCQTWSPMKRKNHPIQAPVALSYHTNVHLRHHRLRTLGQNEESLTDSAMHFCLPNQPQKLQKICMTCQMMRTPIPALMMVNYQLATTVIAPWSAASSKITTVFFAKSHLQHFHLQ